MRRVRGAALLLACVFVAWTAGATPSLTDAGRAAAAKEAARTESAPSPAGIPAADAALPMPASPSNIAMNDPATLKAYLGAMQSYYAYSSAGFPYRMRVFEWQLFSSRLIFATVLLVVLAGLTFAALQFRMALVAAGARLQMLEKAGGKPATPAAPAEPESGALPSLATKMKVSAGGVEVESSVIGLVILALSLGFFYLYLVYVYPVINVF